MPKVLGKLGLVVILVVGLALAGEAWAQYPALQSRVNDYAGVLSPSTVMELEAKLEQFDAETSNEVVVAIVPNMEGIDIDTYRNELFEEWKLGKEERDNGVLLVVAIEERDVGIEVGYGLEGALTDGTAGSIIRNEITPYFKESDFDSGVTAGVDAIIDAIKGEYVATEEYADTTDWVGELIGWGFFLGMIGLSITFSIIGRKKRRVWDPKKKKWVYKKTKGGSSFWYSGGGSGWSGGGGFSGGGGGSGGGGASGGW